MQAEGKQRQKKPVGWKPYSGRNLRSPGLWHPGDPLTEEDGRLLEGIWDTYRRLGYVPARHEVPDRGAIKARFRLWSIALMAAGLPDYNDPDETRRRMAIQERQKRDASAID